MSINAQKVRVHFGGAGEALIAAAWPSTSAAVDEAALEQFNTLQAVVKAVRNARAEYGVELGRKVAATILIRGDEVLRCVNDLEFPAASRCIM